MCEIVSVCVCVCVQGEDYPPTGRQATAKNRCYKPSKERYMYILVTYIHVYIISLNSV